MNKHFIVPGSHTTSCNQGSFSRKEVREPWNGVETDVVQESPK